MYKTRDWDKEPIDPKELTTFYNKVRKLADKTFGVDDEGDSSVDVRLIDRTACRRMHYVPVPYDHREPKAEWLKKAVSVAMLNLNIAHGELETLWRIMEQHRHLRSKEESHAE